MTTASVTKLPLAIAADHPAFAGHFPGRPIVPGVVLLDCGLRAIRAHRGAHDSVQRVASASDTTVRIGSAKFLAVVTPGEPVRLEFEASSAHGYRLRVFAGDAAVERLAMTGSIDFAGD